MPIRDLSWSEGWWTLPTGPLNRISDVAGVSVGHTTRLDGTARTGVTAVLPGDGNLFDQKVPAGAAIINGFGKSLGLLQVMELGEIETPILLTNTFGVPACASALIKYGVDQSPEIGRGSATINPLVLECNDGKVNDIQAMAVTEADANEAIRAVSDSFEQGTVGAGTGMRTFGMAGGIGSASRVAALAGGKEYTVGVLVLSNFGQQGELRILGRRNTSPTKNAGCKAEQERGSIIILVATDAPLESRQLSRIARRGGPALGRLGSYVGHGSGDIAIAFSTAYRLSCENQERNIPRLAESQLDPLFLATIEATEEAILNALYHAESHVGYDGSRLLTLKEHILPNSGGRREAAE